MRVAEGSSAYQTCYISGILPRWLMRGIVAKAKSGIVRGSPWVVPSSNLSLCPSTKSSEGSRYVLMKMVASGGQR